MRVKALDLNLSHTSISLAKRKILDLRFLKIFKPQAGKDR